MKLLKYLPVLLLFFVTLISCDSSENEGELNVVYEDEDAGLDEFEAFSLAPYGINALIYLPGATSDIGAATDPKVSFELDGYKWDLFVGQNFHMRIEDYGDDEMIAFHKDELKEFSNMYDVEYIEESDNFLYYRKTLKVKGKKEASNSVGLDHVSYHCYGVQTIDGVNYVFRTNELGHPKPTTEYMAKSIKSVKQIEK
jgi:hypothetical protein